MRLLLSMSFVMFVLGVPVRADAQGTVVVSPSLARVTMPVGSGSTDQWRWNNDSTRDNRIEYTWVAKIAGDTSYSLGFMLFKFRGTTPRVGTLAELLRAGQANVAIEVGRAGHVVNGVRVTLRAEDGSVVIELRDAAMISTLFAHRPECIMLESLTPKQPRIQQQVAVQYEGFPPP